MDICIHLTDSELEVLRTVAEASGDSIDQYIHSEVIGDLESDIDLYFGHSDAIKEKLFRMAGIKQSNDC